MTIKKLKNLLNISLLQPNKGSSPSTSSSTTRDNNMPNKSSSNKLDKAFDLLEIAIKLEGKGDDIQKNTNDEKKDGKGIEMHMEAASKYYEACTLMKNVLNNNSDRHFKKKNDRVGEKSSIDEKTKRLIKDKIEYYENHAMKLLRCDISSHGKQKTNKACSNNKACSVSDRSIDVNQTWERGNDLSFTEAASSVPTASSRRNLNYYPTEPPVGIVNNNINSSSSSSSSIIIIEKAGKANAHLANALDLDEKIVKDNNNREEAIDEYMKAAKIYIDCLKIIEQHQQEQQGQDTNANNYFSNVLKRRLEGALDRVDFLKSASNNNINKCANSATTLPASNLKSASTSSSSLSLQLSPYEIKVLKRSSLIGSGLFLPWKDEDASLDFTNKRKLYFDPDGYLKLSPTQKKKFYKWARPSEILTIRSKVIREDDKPIMIQNVTPYSIRQTCVTDCSFIASLCICAANERRFHRKLITSIVYPQDATGNPIYNPYGLYVVKLWLNGIARRVIIDDLLPIDKYGNLLCSHTSPSSTSFVLELWVSFIEKAYMKLCGGYDFPGSNSGIDLFSLTGWIPERLIFAQNDTSPRDFETPSERAWERLYGASSFGDCLITVSTTSDLDNKKAEELGLVADHAYAVLNVVKTDSGQRLLQLKNPWASKGWKKDSDKHDSNKDDNGVFWISWSDILIFFRNFHLSWNPTLFTSRYTVHGLWSSDNNNNSSSSLGLYDCYADDSCTLGNNPQYLLIMSDDAIHYKGGTSLWILLSRHVNKQEQEGTVASDFLTLHVYRNNNKKERIWYPGGENRVLLGAYTNNPHVLIRYDVTCPDDKYLSLVLSQYNKQKISDMNNADNDGGDDSYTCSDLGYTLSCYCTHPFTFGNHIALPNIVKKIHSEWNEECAGGSPMLPSFVTNPMFFCLLAKGAHVMLTCSSSQKVAINVMLCNGSTTQEQKKQRNELFPLRKDAVMLESGDYRFGFVVTPRTFIPKGEYICVVSSFEAKQLATFTLIAHSTAPLTITKMP